MTSPNVEITPTDDGRWRVTINTTDGSINEEHVIDEEPSEASVVALLQDASDHKDALIRLLDR